MRSLLIYVLAAALHCFVAAAGTLGPRHASPITTIPSILTTCLNQVNNFTSALAGTPVSTNGTEANSDTIETLLTGIANSINNATTYLNQLNYSDSTISGNASIGDITYLVFNISTSVGLTLVPMENMTVAYPNLAPLFNSTMNSTNNLIFALGGGQQGKEIGNVIIQVIVGVLCKVFHLC